MKCSDYRQIASARLDGQADPGEVRLLESHLAACEACVRFERAMRSLQAGLSEAPPAASPAFRAALFERLDAEGAFPRRSVPSFRLPAWRWAAVPLAAAAGLALFALVGRQAADRAVVGPVAREGVPVASPSAPASPTSEPSPAAPAPPSVAAIPEGAPPASVAAARPPAPPDASGLTPEEAEIVANLDLLEQAESLGLPPEGLDDPSPAFPKGRG